MKNIFDSNAEALVNPVNCVGTMGAGLAKEFRNRYPLNYVQYLKDCEAKNIQIGQCTSFFENGKWIINFPTKDHWMNKSNLIYILKGLASMYIELDKHGIKSIAMPKIGCGFGGLNWNRVLPIIQQFEHSIKDVKIDYC